MSVEVIIPWRAGCSQRGAVLQWCYGWWRWHDVKVTIATAPGDSWNKALAFMPAVERSTADVVVMADADVVCEGIDRAISTVLQGADWARPHEMVVRLSQEGSDEFMGGRNWEGCDLDQRPYFGLSGGGMVVARRETFLEVPMDPRFVGWGQEDHSWGIALSMLLRPERRQSDPLIHLWHPYPERLSRKRGSHENYALFQRYAEARRSITEMKDLLEEARVALAVHQPALHT